MKWMEWSDGVNDGAESLIGVMKQSGVMEWNGGAECWSALMKQ